MRWVPLAALPQAERPQALRAQALAWQPFEHTGHSLVVQGEAGWMVAWDQAAFEAALSASDLPSKRWRLIPEVLMHPPRADGLHLVQGASEGVEGQSWLAGQLQASRWWPHEPDAEAWTQFLRVLPGQSTETPRPALAEAGPWLAKPWALPLSDGTGEAERERESRLVTLGAGALALALGFAGAQTVTAARAVSEQVAANASLRSSLAPVLQQRERALQRAAQAEQWAHWLHAPQPLAWLQHLSDSLGRHQVLLRDFEYRDLKLRMNLQVPANLPRADLMKALQAGGWLVDVAEAKAEGSRDVLRDGVWIEARLSAVNPPMAGLVASPPVVPLPGAAPTAGSITTGAEFASPRSTPPVLPPTAVRPSPGSPGAVPPAARAAPPPGVTTKPIPVPPGVGASDLPPASVFDAIK